MSRSAGSAGVASTSSAGVVEAVLDVELEGRRGDAARRARPPPGAATSTVPLAGAWAGPLGTGLATAAVASRSGTSS